MSCYTIGVLDGSNLWAGFLLYHLVTSGDKKMNDKAPKIGIMIVLLVILLVQSCTDESIDEQLGIIVENRGNRDPIIQAAIISNDHLAFGEDTSIIVLADDPDGHDLDYRYVVFNPEETTDDTLVYNFDGTTLGTITGSGANVTYTAPKNLPEKVTDYIIRVFVADLQNGTFKGGLDYKDIPITIENHVPRITMFSPASPTAEIGDIIDLTLYADDLDDDPLTYRLDVSCSGKLTPSATGSLITSNMKFSFSEFDTWGKIEFRITVSDPTFTTESTTSVRIYPPKISNLRMADFEREYDGWAFGENGLIFHYNGTNWKMENTATDKDIRDFTLIPNSLSAWAVGNNATIRYYDGSNFISFFAPGLTTASDNLFGVSFIDSYTGWITGVNGILLEFDGLGWRKVDIDSTVNDNDSVDNVPITSVHGLAADKAFACGYGNLVIRKEPGTNYWYDERNRGLMPENERVDYKKIHMISTEEGYLWGIRGKKYFLDYYTTYEWPPNHEIVQVWDVEGAKQPSFEIMGDNALLIFPNPDLSEQAVCMIDLFNGNIDCYNEYGQQGLIQTMYLKDFYTGFMAVESAISGWSEMLKIKSGVVSTIPYSLKTTGVTSLAINQIVPASDTVTWAVALIGIQGGVERVTFLVNDTEDPVYGDEFVEWEENRYLDF